MADVSRVNPKKRGRGPDKKKRQTRSVTKKAKAQEKPQLKDAWTQTRPMTCVKFGKRTRQRLEVLEAKMLEINEPWVDRQLTLWVPVVKKTWTFLDKMLLYELFRDYNGSDLNAAGSSGRSNGRADEESVGRERARAIREGEGRGTDSVSPDAQPPRVRSPQVLASDDCRGVEGRRGGGQGTRRRGRNQIDPLAQALKE